MRFLSFILVLILSSSAFAQAPKLRLRPKSYADISKSAQQLRSREKEIRAYYMQLVLRKAQMDVVTILKNNHLSDEDVQKVVDSSEMTKFLTRLENNPRIKARVENHVQKLIKPGAIEAHVLTQRKKIEQKAQEQLIIATNEMRKSKIFRDKEKVHDPIDDRSIASKAWDHFMDDLEKH